MSDSLSPASRVIAAYDALRAVNVIEPDADVLPQAWLEWHSAYRLASDEYRAAVIAFQGDAGSFHPANVLPAARAALDDSSDA